MLTSNPAWIGFSVSPPMGEKWAFPTCIVLYPACCNMRGSVGVVLLRRILPSVLACGCALLAVRGAISATYYTLFYSVPCLSVAARYAQILLLSLLPGAAGYFLVRAVYRRFSEDDI